MIPSQRQKWYTSIAPIVHAPPPARYGELQHYHRTRCFVFALVMCVVGQNYRNHPVCRRTIKPKGSHVLVCLGVGTGSLRQHLAILDFLRQQSVYWSSDARLNEIASASRVVSPVHIVSVPSPGYTPRRLRLRCPTSCHTRSGRPHSHSILSLIHI